MMKVPKRLRSGPVVSNDELVVWKILAMRGHPGGKPWELKVLRLIGEIRRLQGDNTRLHETLDELGLLSKRAADILWAISKRRKPDDDPVSVNQDIYAVLRSLEWEV